MFISSYMGHEGFPAVS